MDDEKVVASVGDVAMKLLEKGETSILTDVMFEGVGMRMGKETFQLSKGSRITSNCCFNEGGKTVFVNHDWGGSGDVPVWKQLIELHNNVQGEGMFCKRSK